MNKKRNIIISIAAVILIVVVFLVWSGARKARTAITADLQTQVAEVGQLEAYVGGTGSVRSNQSATLTWRTSGTVSKVDAGMGESVQAGEVLARLSDASLPQNVILAEADLVSAQNALDDLNDSYGPLALAVAQQTLADARKAAENAQDEWDSLHYKGTQDEINDAEAKLNDAQHNLDQAEQSFGKNSAQYRRVYQLYASALSHYNYVSGNSVDKVVEAQYAANLEVANQKLADAQSEYDRLQAGPTTDETAAAEARITAARATLEQAWIEAPFDGTITMAQPLPGDQVSAGQTAFRIDDLSRLLVDVQISEVDINRVQVGQPAQLTFDAILNQEYEGEVIAVSPVGVVEQGLVNFKVTIALTHADEQIKPGMTAAVNIRVEKLENVLLVPNRAVRVSNGNRVVYIMGDNGLPTMVNIELGATSDMNSEVIGGDLKEGDEIILNPSTSLFDMMDGGSRGGPFGGN